MSRVVVIGAGPAGCSAALTLAARGVETIILERKTLPRPKTCAGGLSPWTLEWLRGRGLFERVSAEGHAIRGARLWMRDSASPISLRGRLEAVVLPRERFDSMLAGAACQAGAELREGVTVRSLVRDGERLVGVETDSGQLDADAAVVACGATGRLASRPAREHDRFFGIMTRFAGLRGIDDTVELFLDQQLGLQYGWVFPESATVANVGICYQRGPRSPNARELLDRFLDRYLARRLEGASAVARVQAHPIRAVAWPRGLVEDGTLYVGEAAGLVDPLTGEGIWLALRSGELAGICLAARLARRQPATRSALASYAAAVGLRLAPRLLASAAGLELVRSRAARPVAALIRSGRMREVVQRLYPHF
jgi:menaquinone-9 beta-reductase